MTVNRDLGKAMNVSGEKDRLMKDTIQTEKEFEQKHTLRGHLNDFCPHMKFVGRYYSIVYPIVAIIILGLPTITVGIWAIVQCTQFFPITTQASISVIIISVLVITVGVLIIAVTVGFGLFVKYERASYNYKNGFNICKILIKYSYIPLIIVFVILTVLGIAAGALIPGLSESIGTSANISFFHGSQGDRDAWNGAQITLRCCGAMNFSDYEQVFNNFSVPVSCCNTTNPLANETTCPDIVMDTNVTTELIYTEGCVPQLVSYFHYIHSVIAGFSIGIGATEVLLIVCMIIILYGVLAIINYCID